MEGASNSLSPLGAAIPNAGRPPFRILGGAHVLDRVVLLDKPPCKACGGQIRHTVTVGYQPQVYFHQRKSNRDCRLGFWLDPDRGDVRIEVIGDYLSDREWVTRKLAILRERVR